MCVCGGGGVECGGGGWGWPFVARRVGGGGRQKKFFGVYTWGVLLVVVWICGGGRYCMLLQRGIGYSLRLCVLGPTTGLLRYGVDCVCFLGAWRDSVHAE